MAAFVDLGGGEHRVDGEGVVIVIVMLVAEALKRVSFEVGGSEGSALAQDLLAMSAFGAREGLL